MSVVMSHCSLRPSVSAFGLKSSVVGFMVMFIVFILYDIWPRGEKVGKVWLGPESRSVVWHIPICWYDIKTSHRKLSKLVFLLIKPHNRKWTQEPICCSALIRHVRASVWIQSQKLHPKSHSWQCLLIPQKYRLHTVRPPLDKWCSAAPWWPYIGNYWLLTGGTNRSAADVRLQHWLRIGRESAYWSKQVLVSIDLFRISLDLILLWSEDKTELPEGGQCGQQQHTTITALLGCCWHEWSQDSNSEINE